MTSQIKKRECPKCSITMREWYDRQEFTGYKCDNCQYEIDKNEMPATNQTDWEERFCLDHIELVGTVLGMAYGTWNDKRITDFNNKAVEMRDKVIKDFRAELAQARKEERERVLREVKKKYRSVTIVPSTFFLNYLDLEVSKLTKERE